MNNIIELAKLLEQAATALRGVAVEMKKIPSTKGTLNDLPGYKQSSVRLRRALHRKEIRDIEQLYHMTADDLLEVKNFGYSSLTELRELLNQNGIYLKGEKKHEDLAT